jgi:hypothetical protein
MSFERGSPLTDFAETIALVGVRVACASGAVLRIVGWGSAGDETTRAAGATAEGSCSGGGSRAGARSDVAMGIAGEREATIEFWDEDAPATRLAEPKYVSAPMVPSAAPKRLPAMIAFLKDAVALARAAVTLTTGLGVRRLLSPSAGSGLIAMVTS